MQGPIRAHARRMTRLARRAPAAGFALLFALALAGCATRPVNPPIPDVHPDTGYRFEVRQRANPDKENLVILAFSGGGTRAAAILLRAVRLVVTSCTR